MRSLFVTLFTAALLCGCNNGQPRLYRVAWDDAPLRGGLLSGCYVGNQAPSGPQNNYENYYPEAEWVIWGGDGATEYLDMGDVEWSFANAHPVKVYGLIAGENMTFSANRKWHVPENAIDNNTGQTVLGWTHAYETVVTATFDNYSFSPTGSVTLDSKYACANNSLTCPGQGSNPSPPPHANCTGVKFDFQARLVETNNVGLTNPNPSTGGKE